MCLAGWLDGSLVPSISLFVFSVICDSFAEIVPWFSVGFLLP